MPSSAGCANLRPRRDGGDVRRLALPISLRCLRDFQRKKKTPVQTAPVLTMLTPMWLNRRLLLILLGGASFWGPLTLIELLSLRNAGFYDMALITLLPPAGLLKCYFVFRRNHSHWAISMSLWLLLGVYLLGSLFISIGATPHQGGFSQFHGWNDVKWLLVSAVVPFVTILMSGYQGSIFGLLSVTVIMFVIHFNLERKLPRD